LRPSGSLIMADSVVHIAEPEAGLSVRIRLDLPWI